MGSTRRVGSENSKTRDDLLDSVERLMLNTGYAGVTYRAVAADAGVTGGLVQYYFPALDDLFTASIRRYTERNVNHLVEALDRHADEPLHIVWEYSKDESSAALMMEYMALGNHRRSIRAEIAGATSRVRQVQLEALTGWRSRHVGSPTSDLSPDALLLLINGVPKLIQLFEGVGLSNGHPELLDHFERYLDAIEPLGREHAAPSQVKTSAEARTTDPLPRDLVDPSLTAFELPSDP